MSSIYIDRSVQVFYYLGDTFILDDLVAKVMGVDHGTDEEQRKRAELTRGFKVPRWTFFICALASLETMLRVNDTVTELVIFVGMSPIWHQ